VRSMYEMIMPKLTRITMVQRLEGVMCVNRKQKYHNAWNFLRLVCYCTVSFVVDFLR
jgi:hypothetical protein